MGVIFNLQNSHSLTLSLPTEVFTEAFTEAFTEVYTAKIGQWLIFQLSLFVLSR